MNAIILAAGFGERTKNVLSDMPKALIRVSDGKTILDHIITDLDTAKIQNITIVTNAKFFPVMSEYVARTYKRENIIVINDGSISPDTRLGALGDLLFAIKKSPHATDEPLLVLPSDTAYWQSFTLEDFLAFAAKHSQRFVTAVYDVHDTEKIRGHLGCVLLDGDGRIIDFEEKPDYPKSTLAIVAMYVFNGKHMQLLSKFRDEGGDLNSPSNIIPYLMDHNQQIFGFFVKGNIIDANKPDEIESAKKY